MKVLEGKDGWLFLDNDSNYVVKQHTGEVILSDSELELWRLTLENRIAWLKYKGIPYIFFVPPDSHAIYPEYLPDHIQPAATRPVSQIYDALKSSPEVEFVYPLKQMKSRKDDMLVCCTTDSHWTHFGAYIAYCELMKSVRKYFPSIKILEEDDLIFDEQSFLGDLGSKLEPQQEGMMVYGRVANPSAIQTQNNNIINRGNITVYQGRDSSMPSAILFRDSYGMWIDPYMAESFSKLVVVASPLLEHDIIEQIKPDIVISELAERFLIKVPDDLRGEKVRDLILEKQRSGE